MISVNLLYINIIQIIILLLMCFMVYPNTRLNVKQKTIFISTFIIIIFLSSMEHLSALTNNGNPKLRIASIIFNYLGFAFAPFVPLLFAYAVYPNKNIKYPLIILGVFELFFLISLPFGWVFDVSKENIYSRGNAYITFIIAYVSCIIYLLIVSVQMGIKYQNNNSIILFLNFAFLIAGTSIQLFIPDVHVTWICVTASSIIYYEYCNNLWHQIDGLTKLLSQESFISITKKIKSDGILVIFDIDKFKLINDTYGHYVGDEYLKVFGEKLLKVYGKYGYCYRIGGDEFLVLLDPETDVDGLNEKFYQSITPYNENYVTDPNVSFGVSSFKKGDNILQIKDMADAEMYEQKRMHQLNNKLK